MLSERTISGRDTADTISKLHKLSRNAGVSGSDTASQDHLSQDLAALSQTLQSDRTQELVISRIERLLDTQDAKQARIQAEGLFEIAQWYRCDNTEFSFSEHDLRTLLRDELNWSGNFSMMKDAGLAAGLLTETNGRIFTQAKLLRVFAMQGHADILIERSIQDCLDWTSAHVETPTSDHHLSAFRLSLDILSEAVTIRDHFSQAAECIREEVAKAIDARETNARLTTLPEQFLQGSNEPEAEAYRHFMKSLESIRSNTAERAAVVSSLSNALFRLGVLWTTCSLGEKITQDSLLRTIKEEDDMISLSFLCEVATECNFFHVKEGAVHPTKTLTDLFNRS